MFILLGTLLGAVAAPAGGIRPSRRAEPVACPDPIVPVSARTDADLPRTARAGTLCPCEAGSSPPPSSGWLLLGLAPAGSLAAEPNFPAKDSRYHNYPEMVDEIMQAEADYPDLVKVSSIGKSYKGRDIWVAKVSDNVATDEPEPEVLIDALHHAREHLTTEQALYLLKTLTHDYATDSVVKRLVDSREIWIVFALNPDGMQYDLTGNPYRAWRKNRQPNAGSTHIGTDLNRNYDYDWGCCRGSSGSPASLTYRGKTAVLSAGDAGRARLRQEPGDRRAPADPAPHHAPHERRAHPLAVRPHEGRTSRSDMSRDDHYAFVALGKRMAQRNGYKPMQSSDLYITDGDQIDWMYGRYRIFSFTWELYPTEHYRVSDFYPADEKIAAAVANNRSALLYAIDMADCPYSPIDKTKTLCGPLNDDFEINRGWARNPDGTDRATDGRWAIGDPSAVSYRGHPMQLGTTTSGRYALVTGPAGARGVDANDVDGGVTTIRSAPVEPARPGRRPDLPLLLRPSRELDRGRLVPGLGRGRGRDPDPGQGGARDADRYDAARWASARIDMTPWAGQTVRIVIGAADGGADTRVEAAVDDLRIERP